MKQKITILWVGMMLCAQLEAQLNVPTALKIGDQLPAITIKNVHNYPTDTLNLATLRGKLVIFDFWGAYCAPCVAAFPKLDSLQQQFGDKIQIILVTSSTKGYLDTVFTKQSKTSAIYRKRPSLTMVTGDSILHRLFPHELIPHEVWISNTGKVQSITADRYVTAANIENILLDGRYRLPEKKDFLAFDPRQAMFPQLYQSFPNNLKYYTTIMKYIPFVGTQTFYIDSSQGILRFSRVGSPLGIAVGAFTRSTADNPFESPVYDFGKRVELNIKDTAKCFYPGDQSGMSYDDWKTENRFVVEKVMPIVPQDSVYREVLLDMNRYFSISIKSEKRRRNCISIELVDDDSSKLQAHYPAYERSQKGFTAKSYIDSNGHYQGYSIGLLRMALSKNNRTSPYCFVDNTGYKNFAKITLQAGLTNFDAVNRELKKKYNLQLVKKELELDVLVISDKL